MENVDLIGKTRTSMVSDGGRRRVLWSNLHFPCILYDQLFETENKSTLKNIHRLKTIEIC